ncbi:MAG: NAD(P)H-binding protein [Candidatus Palauibacterales bacterium]|nr:NAD(P)H-binding protein [Candidatus Palauibacterales bacterium]
MYAVVGATGNTGRPLAEALLARGARVRVIGRSAERLRPLVEKGAEQFIGSVEDRDAMVDAFSGARAVYSLIPQRLDVDDLRAYQRKCGEAIAHGIKKAGVEYAVNLSGIGAQHTEGTGSIAGLREHEDRLNAVVGLNVVHLRGGYFFENHLHGIDMIKKLGVAGSALLPDLSIPQVAARDIAAVAADLLLELGFSGSSKRELLGERDLTMREAVGVLGRAIGKDKLRYVQFAYSAAEFAMMTMGVSQGVAQQLIEVSRGFNEGRVVPEEARSAENTTPTSIEEFSEVFAKAYVGEG